MVGRPPLEVADVFRCPEAQALVGRYPARHRRVVRALTACRTAMLGGHVGVCDECGHREISYNSCRDRHCPKCQGSAARDWVEAQQAHVLPVPYCHAVFTLPQELAVLALQNQTLLYGLLFRCASETLLKVASDPRHLGARIGFIAILHTWGQKLELHPHLHCLIPAGGLARDRSRWIPCRPGFFLPVRVLSRCFRGKYLAALEDLYRAGKLRHEGDLAALADPRRFAHLIAQLRDHEWVVYARPPFGGSEQVLKYLARYTHCVAISNGRLRTLQDQRVSFEWKDYARGQQSKLVTMDVTEFARRFLLHVLPKRFVRLRYYGLLAGSCRKRQLELCRQLLEPQPQAPTSSSVESSRAQTGDASCDPADRRCPACQKGKLRWAEILAPDTS